MPADADPSLNTGKVKMEFKAGIEPVSRTELIDGTEQNFVNWEANDTISLFDPNSNNIFITSEGGRVCNIYRFSTGWSDHILCIVPV